MTVRSTIIYFLVWFLYFFIMSDIRFDSGRICDVCNKRIHDGFTNMEGEFCCCDLCFYSFMDKRFGINDWRLTDDDGCDGFYEYKIEDSEEWAGTGIFWTQWS